MEAIDSISSVSARQIEGTQPLAPQSRTAERFEKLDTSTQKLELNSANTKSAIDPSDAATKKLQSMFISQLVGEIFKEQSESTFGEGAQGDFYASVFADTIANSLAEQDILGFDSFIKPKSKDEAEPDLPNTVE